MDIDLISATQKRTKADLLIAGFFEKGALAKDWAALESDFPKMLQTVLGTKRFEGKCGQSFYSYRHDYKEASEILLLGLGEKKKYGITCLRKAAGEAIKQMKARKAVRVRILLDSFLNGEVTATRAVEAVAEVSLLASYEFNKYKTEKNGKEEPGPAGSIEILFVKKQKERELKGKIENSRHIAEAVLFARDLVNEPGNVMNAAKVSEIARELAGKKKLSCKVLDEKELKKLRMGGILAVNQGSVNPPALVVLEYGSWHKNKGTLCLVGKGVTFDTGGISIKAAKDMEKMKYDMSGAAAVLAAMGVASDLKLPLHLVGLAPMVENNVAENPQRPGDIIRMYNGKTVEVINTDAEGRLILGDALAYAGTYKPKAIIDLATLTGMCAYTFGDKAIGLLGNNDRLIERVKKAGDRTGERCWQLPLWDEYREQIKGHHSDFYNTGGPYGGTITAAMFLKQFVPEGASWAHLDIAGTAWCENPRYDCPKGATGVGVRLLAALLSDWK